MVRIAERLDADSLEQNLSTLLNNLRIAGLPVYPRDIERIQQACRLAPPTHRQGFLTLIQCTLASNPKEQEIVAEQFDLWWRRTASWVEDIENPEALIPQPIEPIEKEFGKPGRPGKKTRSAIPGKSAAERWKRSRSKRLAINVPWRKWWKWWRQRLPMILLTGFCCLAIVAVFWYFQPEGPVSAIPAPGPAPTEKPAVADPAFKPVAQYHAWAPEKIEVAPRDQSLPILLSVLLAAVPLGFFVLYRYRRSTTRPPEAVVPWQGPSWRPLLPEYQQVSLLQPDELRRSAWAVERFTAEQATRRLDIGRTVAATCREGGIPVLYYQRARYPKEIWLWRDELSQAPAALRCFEDLQTGLSRLALPVRSARFWGTPVDLYSDTGKAFSPLDVEKRREQVWLFLFSDGRALKQQLDSALQGPKLAAVLRSLALWPKLAFVDTGSEGELLGQHPAPFGIECIKPEQVAAKLGGVMQSPSGLTPNMQNQLRTWQAAACLSADPISWDTARALLQALKLKHLSPWHFPALAAAGEAGVDDLTWPGVTRRKVLDWLAQSQIFNANNADASDLGKALAFWRRHYQLENDKRTRIEKQGGKRWIDTPAQLRIQMELAFLSLWDKPVEAVRDLYRLYQNKDFRSDINYRIRDYTSDEGLKTITMDGRSDTLIRLPWRWRDLRGQSPLLLQDMGFQPPRGRRLMSRISGTLAMALGFATGLLFVGVYQLAQLWHQGAPVSAMDPVFDDAAFQAQIIQDRTTLLASTRLVVGSAKLLTMASAKANQQFRLDWKGGWRSRENFASVPGGVIWYTGTLAQPIRGCESGWPRRSLVILDTDPNNGSAQILAAVLLDKGSADKVLIGNGWDSKLAGFQELPPELTGPDQLIVVTDREVPQPDFQGKVSMVRVKNLTGVSVEPLIETLDFTGLKSIDSVWKEETGVVSIEGDIAQLRGSPVVTEDPESGLEFARVCGGSFTMGGDEYSNERPRHTVILDGFELAVTETTNAQYKKYDASWEYADGEENHPAVKLDWTQAKTYCKNYGYRLPSEAEWEYAARGGSQAKWSFGDDQGALRAYAWYSDNGGGETHSVRDRKSNPLGLFDIHGNAWEWVADWYGPYEEGQQNNPSGPDTGTFRSLRGGSAWVGARGLRSARRFRYRPVVRFDRIGFRCARAPAASS